MFASACSSDNSNDVRATATTRHRTTTTAAVDDTSTSTGASTTLASGPATTTRGTTKPPDTTGGGATPVDRPALQKMATLDEPIALAVRRNDTSVYVAEKGGAVRRLAVNGNRVSVTGTVLDISQKVSTGGEQGLLGIAFSPDGSKLYADYTNSAGDTRVVEYPFNGAANASAERLVLAVDQPYPNHNGGEVVFGPDNMLYIGLGDGGSGGDPQNNAQNLNSLLGKILRINPAQSGTQPYTIPAGNPFAGQSGKRGEIWHYGLRNPWRFSFDRATGDQWIGDVGQNAWEEIDHVAAGRKGVNFGWRLREGDHAYNGGARPAGAVDPVHEYSHSGGNCSVTGGYVYRGSAIRGFAGTYVFGDYCGGRLQALGASGVRDLALTVDGLVSFGEDAGGELWILSQAGGVYRLVAA